MLEIPAKSHRRNISVYIVMGLIALVLLAAAVVLAVIGIRLVLKRDSVTDARSAQQIDDALRRLGSSVEHYATVHAVLALTKEFKSNPDLLENLSSYSREVVGAALLHRVNALGADIKEVQGKLSSYRKLEVDGGYGSFGELIRGCETMLSSLYAELDAANVAAQQFNRPRAVS